MSARPQTEGDVLPRELESPRAKLVYLFLSTRGEASIGTLQEALHIEKMTLYSILDTLEGRDLVRKDRDAYRPA